MASNAVNDYGWDSSSEPLCHQVVAPKIVAILPAFSPKRILDIGSGNGALCNRLSRLGYQVAGVEYDSKGVQLARSNFPHIPFYQFGVQDDSSALLEKEDRFDAVISTEVIEHLYSPQLLLQYARNVLQQNGVLILSTPYHGYLKNLVLSLIGAWDGHFHALWEGGHIKFWSRKTLTKLLEQNGYKVLQFHGVGRFPFLWKSMVLVAQAANSPGK